MINSSPGYIPVFLNGYVPISRCLPCVNRWWWICEPARRNVSQRPATGTSPAEEDHRAGDAGGASQRHLQNDSGKKTIRPPCVYQIFQWMDPLAEYCSTKPLNRCPLGASVRSWVASIKRDSSTRRPWGAAGLGSSPRRWSLGSSSARGTTQPCSPGKSAESWPLKASGNRPRFPV